MKVYLAALAAIALVPIAACAGYVANGNDIPEFGKYVSGELSLKHVPGQDSDDWIAVATTGPNKGGALDVLQALFSAPTHGALEAQAQGKVIYVELKCENYATAGDKILYRAKDVVRKCVSTQKTRKQVEKYVLDQLRSEPKS